MPPRKTIWLFTVFLFLIPGSTPLLADEIPNAENLYRNTVVLTNGYAHGSGVLFSRDDRTFIWTAGHVADLFENRSNGTYRIVTVIQGDQKGTARVLRGGDCDYARDFALFEVIEGNFGAGDSHFFRAYNEVYRGQEIIHCGTPYDRDWNERLVTFGRISNVDHECGGPPLVVALKFDMIDITGGPGCSGGPVIDEKDGGILGLLVMDMNNRMLVMEPTRYLHVWAAEHDCLWAFDRDIPVPSEIVPWLSDRYLRECKRREPGEGWGESPEEEGKNILLTILSIFFMGIM
jgi:hypothetical protein